MSVEMMSGLEFLDVSRSAADVENAAFGTAVEQLPVKVPIQQADRFLLFPLRAMGELALVQAVRASLTGKTRALKPL